MPSNAWSRTSNFTGNVRLATGFGAASNIGGSDHELPNLIAMPGIFMLSGFTDAETYERREPSWEPDDEFVDVDTATEAAQVWLRNQPSASQVEVIEVEGPIGRVKRVVDPRGSEEIS